MEHYTIEQSVFIIEKYLKNNESLMTTFRKFHSNYEVYNKQNKERSTPKVCANCLIKEINCKINCFLKYL